MYQLLIETSWLIPCYGLVGALLCLPWAMNLIRRSGSRPAAYLNIFTTLLAMLHGGLVFAAIYGQPSQQIMLHWFNAAGLDLSFALDISSVTVGAMELVSVLCLLAQVYALGYLEKDWALARFFGLMGFFEAAMSGLVISDSLFLTYALLESLTLSTYLLVGFWYAQPLVVTAARDAFLTKRVGDVLLLMGMVAISTMAGSLNFEDIYQWSATANLAPGAAALLGVVLIAGPTGKSAQFPLHLWLDEAMEGPSPASILRNSIVVSSGAYVLIKLQPVFVMSPVSQVVLLIIGSVTAIGASLVALAQIDIKRALSHSSSAFMGLVFISVGLQWTDFALMLLLVHAIAKALIFMSIGGIITATTSQDLTEMGGLWRRMPATTMAFAVGSAGLVGLLPLGTFWALERGLDHFWQNPFAVTIVLATNGLTGLNLVRVFRLVFMGAPKAKSRRTPEMIWSMAVPMVTLTIGTLVLPFGLHRLGLLPELADFNWGATGLLVLSSAIGLTTGALIPLSQTWARPIQPVQRFIQDLLAYDFYVDKFYKVTVVSAVALVSRIIYWFDQNILGAVVTFVGMASIFTGESLKYSINGRSQGYMLTIMLGIGLMGLYLTWSKGQLVF
jgi:NAD(P)H-quinone oxidoreductase subunit 5